MANEESFSFNGTDFSTFGVTMVRPFLPWLSPAAIRYSPLTMGDGGITATSDYGPRVFTIPCVIHADSFADLSSKLDAMAKVLSQREDQQLIFDMVPGRYWLAKPAGLPDLASLSHNIVDFEIVFFASDPHAYAVTGGTSGSISIPPGSPTVTPGGTIETYPIITVLVNATVSTFVIENDALDQRIEWISPSAGENLIAGDSVQIDCRPRFQTVAFKRAAIEVDFFNVVMNGVNGRFLQLTPSATNTITFTNITSSSGATITWTDRYQ